MTIFLVYREKIAEKKYVIRDALCLGRPCLNLGTRRLNKPFLQLTKKDINRINCCTHMIDTGCPTDKNKKYKFSVEERFKNIQKGYYTQEI